MAEEAPASPSTARRVEETYLADRTLDWLEAFVGQNLRSLGLPGLEGVLRNGKVLRFVADKLGDNADLPSAFSKEDLTEERKGFRAVSDVDFFLGTCRSIGLADHQLFSASDVIAYGVGEEGTLRVCRTVRSLSVSCRERGIQVSLNPKIRARQVSLDETRRVGTLPDFSWLGCLSQVPMFETGKQKKQARQRGMSTSATSDMVEAVGKKLGLEDKDEEGVSKERKLKRALVAGLLAGLGASVASRLLGPRGLRLMFHF